MIRATLAIMAYGGVHPETLRSVLLEINRDDGVRWIVYVHAGDAAIDRARSLILSKFLADGDSDAVMMIDHDMSWAVGDAARVTKLAVEHKGIVGALCSKRAIGAGYGGRFADGLPHKLYSDELVRLGRNGYVGGAFTAVDRSVVDRLKSRLKRNKTAFWPLCMPYQVESDSGEIEYLSEDWALCRRCYDAAIPVYIDMHPRVVHHGSFGYTLNHAVDNGTCTHVKDDG